MPFRRKGRKRIIRRRRKGGKKGFWKKKNPAVFTMRVPTSMHMPIAPRLKTKFFFSTTCFLAAGAASTNFYTVKGNSLNIPLSVNALSASYNNVPNPSIAVGTAQPAGFTALVGLTGQPYNNFRIYGSKITIRANCGTQADCFSMVLAPVVMSASTIGAPVQAYTSYTDLMSAPYAVQRAINIGMPNVLSMYMDCSTIFGKTKRAVQDLDSFVGALGVSPTNLFGYTFAYRTGGGIVTANTLTFVIELVYYVELSLAASDQLTTP